MYIKWNGNYLIYKYKREFIILAMGRAGKDHFTFFPCSTSNSEGLSSIRYVPCRIGISKVKLKLVLISKTKLRLYNFSFTNYAGSRCCCVSNGMRQQLAEIKQAINDWKVNQTGESEVFRKEKQQLGLIGQEKMLRKLIILMNSA